MSGGSKGGSNTTVQKADPWGPIQPHLKEIYGEAKNLYNQPGPSLYPGSWTAPRNPLQNEAENRALGYSESPRIANMMSGAESALTGELLANPWANPTFGNMRGMMPVANMAMTNSMLNSMTPMNQGITDNLSGDPFRNPYTQKAIDANAGNMVENFNKHVMPSMRSNITAYNPGGSSRGDIAQGLAYEGLQDNIADMTTRMNQGAYDSAMQRQLQAGGMAEQARSSRAGESLAQAQGIYTPALAGENAITRRLTAGAGLYPGMMAAPLSMMKIAQDVGISRRSEAQRAVDEARERFGYQENLPYQKLMQYAGLLNNPGGAGSSTSTQTAQGGSGGGFGGFASGAIGGASAGSVFGPWGAGIGGLLGGIGGLF